jgi:F-type H+-transporting ATPase subunit b
MENMGTYSYLVAASEGGFDLKLDILDTNLVNLVIIIGILFYFGRKFLGSILSERRSRIEQEIQEAEKAREDAAAALADAEQKLAQAQSEVQRIRQSAQESAKNAKERILAENSREIERIKETAVQDMDAERERAINEIKQQVTTQAIERVESQLRKRLDDKSIQEKLIDRSLAELGGSR